MSYESSSSSSRGAANSTRLSRTVATLAALTSYTTTAQNSQPQPSLCSCSPTKFNFQLNFQGSCESTSLTGVSDELCFINVRPGGTESVAESGGDVDVENILSKMSVIDVRRKKEDFWRRLVDTNYEHGDSNQRALNSVIPTVVTSLDIFEYDTTNELTVINQQVFSNQTLSNGDIIEFTSISSKLDPNKPLQEQLEYFPGGLILRYTGVNSNNEDVINTFAWEYNIEDCTTEQISGGDFIGWMIVDDVTAANGAFCPATVTSPPTSSPTTLLAPTTAKPVNPPTSSPTTSTTTQKPVTTTTTTKSSKHPTPKPSKSGKVPSTSKSSKASHSPIHDDWSGSGGHHHHHKPTTPSPVYNWKDKPTTSPIYDWAAGTEKDPTTETFIDDVDVKPPSVLGGKSSKWYSTSEQHTSTKHVDVDEESW
eukprot:scaffold5600_cov144-Skeletonema_marinoi.AAC.5